MKSKKKTGKRKYSIVEQAEKVTSQYEIEVLKKEMNEILGQLIQTYRKSLHNRDWSRAMKILQAYISQPLYPMQQEPKKNITIFIHKSHEWIEKTRVLFEVER